MCGRGTGTRDTRHAADVARGPLTAARTAPHAADNTLHLFALFVRLSASIRTLTRTFVRLFAVFVPLLVCVVLSAVAHGADVPRR